MNILQLCKYYPPVLGGIELVEKTITKAHNDLGDKVVIAAFAEGNGNRTGEFGEIIYQIKEDLFFKSAPLSFSFLFHFKRIVSAHNIQRIYVHLPNPYMHEVLKIFSGYLKKQKIDVVAVYHSDIVNQRFLGRLYNSYFSLSKNIYDRWICSSEKLWNSSPILKSIDKTKSRIIPFCTEGHLQFKQRDSFNKKILAIGRLVPYKGFEFLIRALSNTEYDLHIIGDGPEYEKLKSIAGPNVFLHRRLAEEQKKTLFDESELMVVSSINRAEAYGMIIVEAFESGLPVVASNIDSGVTFLVQHEKTGLVFDINNKTQLIENLERLKKDKDFYRSLSVQGRNFFDTQLKYDHFREHIKNL